MKCLKALMLSDIYLETCPLWGFEWKSGTYSSHNTTSGPMRLILPNRNNVLQNIYLKKKKRSGYKIFF